MVRAEEEMQEMRQKEANKGKMKETRPGRVLRERFEVDDRRDCGRHLRLRRIQDNHLHFQQVGGGGELKFAISNTRKTSLTGLCRESRKCEVSQKLSPRLESSEKVLRRMVAVGVAMANDSTKPSELGYLASS